MALCCFTFVLHLYSSIILAEPHSSIGGVADLRTGGRWIDPRLGQYSFRGLMIVIATFLSRCPLFRQWLFGKAASGLESAKHWLKELHGESMDRCTDRRDITEIPSKHLLYAYAYAVKIFWRHCGKWRNCS